MGRHRKIQRPSALRSLLHGIYTDNNPLTYVLSTDKLNATGQRCGWVAELADFNFSIRYLPGKKNGAAVALSRLPTDFDQFQRKWTMEVSPNVLQATAMGVEAQANGDSAVVSAFMAEGKDILETMEKTLEPLQKLSREELQEAQDQDPVIGPEFKAKQAGRSITRKERRQLPKLCTILLHEWKHLEMEDGLLHRNIWNTSPTGTPNQIPKSCPQAVAQWDGAPWSR